MHLAPFAHDAPTDLAGAVRAVHDGSVPYCGGTELLAAMGMGLVRPERVVSLRRVDELRSIDEADGWLRIGSTVTHQTVGTSPLVSTVAPMLGGVARRVGNIRVRSTGTIGGNLAFAEPRSDVVPSLIVLGARVRLVGGPEERTVSVRDFVVGPYETALDDGELLVRVEVPVDVVDIAVYHKIVFSERPVVGVAIARDRISKRWTLAVGAAVGEPFVVEVADLDDVEPSGLAAELDVIADLAGSEDYKRHLAATAIRRAASEARHDPRYLAE